MNSNLKYVNFFIGVTIFLIGMFAFLQVYSVQAILPILMKDFSISEIKVGILVGATVLGIALMSPITGILSDMIGRKKIIVLSLIFLSIPTFAMSTVTSTSMLIALRFLQGLFVPGITVVTIAYIAEEYQGQILTRLMAIYVSGTVLGGFLGRFVLGHLQELIGWRYAFGILGLLTLLGSIWVVYMLPNSKKFIANPDFISSKKQLFIHTKDYHLLSACLLGACVLFTLVGAFTFINLHLTDEPYHFTTGQLGSIFTVYLLGVVITPLTTKILQRFGISLTITLAILLSMLGIIMTIARPISMIIIGLAVMSSGVFITQSATISYIAVNISKGRSLASGLYYTCYYIGGSLGSWVCALAYNHNKWQAVVSTIIMVQVLALIIVNRLMTKH